MAQSRTRVWTLPATWRCNVRPLIATGQDVSEGRSSTSPDQIMGATCHHLTTGLRRNCVLGRRTSAGLHEISNMTRRRPGFVHSRTNWTNGRMLSKLPPSMMMSDAVTA